MSFVEVQEALAEVMGEDSARTQITVDQIIAEAAKLAFLNMDEDDGLPWGLHWRRLTEVKFGGNLRISRCDKCHSENPRGQASSSHASSSRGLGRRFKEGNSK